MWRDFYDLGAEMDELTLHQAAPLSYEFGSDALDLGQLDSG